MMIRAGFDTSKPLGAFFFSFFQLEKKTQKKSNIFNFTHELLLYVFDFLLFSSDIPRPSYISRFSDEMYTLCVSLLSFICKIVEIVFFYTLEPNI